MTDLETLARTLNEMQHTLAADNAKADRVAYQRYVASVKDAVRTWGTYNALACIPNVLRGFCSENEEHYSQAERDYLFAAEVIEAVIVAVDLNYGERSTESDRKQRLEAALETMRAVRID